jgi:hypothetical protein
MNYKIYVSPTGDGSGTEMSPCSLDDARDIVRAAKPHVDGDIEVILAGGTYNRYQPLVLTSDDSGSPGKRIIWRAGA